MSASKESLKGDVAELKTMATLEELGHVVSEPRSDAEYDIIADIDGKLYKLQVKTGRYRNDKTEYSLTATLKCSSGYTYSDVDAFVIYNPHQDELYWMWSNETGQTSANVCLRDKSEMNGGNLKRANMRDEVLLESVVKDLP